MQQGTKAAPNPDELSVDVHLMTAGLRLSLPSQTQLSLQLPAGRLRTQSLQGSRTDSNIGDVELGVTQALPWLKTPRFRVGLGLVAPTGPYVAKSGAANLPPEASFLTLGRGVYWAVAELGASMPIGPNASAYLQVTGRSPLGETEDDFKWGAEARSVLGGQYQLPYGLAALAIAELQWRGRASEPDPFAGTRVESANAGGVWATLTPAISYSFIKSTSLLAGLRVPVHTDVHGNQLVPSIGGFVSLASSWSSAASTSPSQKPALPAFVAPRPTPGRITIIDYWATWCAPCKVIDAALEEASPTWDDVEIVRVNASGWPDDGVQLPDGVDGLPAIEIYDAQGQRKHLLLGTDALDVVNIINAMRIKNPPATSKPSE